MLLFLMLWRIEFLMLGLFCVNGALGTVRVGDCRIVTNAGNYNVGYQGCNFKLVLLH